MQKVLSIVLLIMLVNSAMAQNLPMPTKLTRLAFGSCNQNYKDQTFWPNIKATNPDLWLWLGDIIYTDKMSVEQRSIEFLKQKQNPYYSAFHKEVPIVGIWDDHDYGDNDIGVENPQKRQNQKLLWDFLDIKANSSLYHQEGAYQAYTFGEKGQQTLLLILDVRYFREAPYRNRSMLGNKQWQWLEQQLSATKAGFIMIASPTQVLPMAYGERWANFSTDKAKLIRLIGQTQRNGTKVLLLTGDRHFGEISKIRTDRKQDLYEISSSGLTHFNSDFVGPDTIRVGAPIVNRNFGSVEIDWVDNYPVPDVTIHLHYISGQVFKSISL